MSEYAPEGAVCIEDDCTRPATTTRPASEAWITDDGVIFDADEWVCAGHAEGEK